MPPIRQPKSQELLQSWIDTILDEASDNLTDWETKFLDNIQTQLNLSGRLSEKQEDVLERIYAQKTQ